MDEKRDPGRVELNTSYELPKVYILHVYRRRFSLSKLALYTLLLVCLSSVWAQLQACHFT